MYILFKFFITIVNYSFYKMSIKYKQLNITDRK